MVVAIRMCSLNQVWLVYLFTFSVEDPSEDFVRLRDFVDVSNGLKLVSAFADPEIVKAGFSEDMVKVNR